MRGRPWGGLWVLSLSLVLLVAAGCGLSSQGSGGPMKIGLLIEQTGVFSWYGEENQNGAQLYLDEINNGGGINGRKLELAVYNSESAPDKALAGARKLSQQDKVIGIVGLGLIGEAQAVAPAVAEGPPTYSTSGAYLPENRMMFGGTVFVGDTQKRALQFLAEKNIKRVALLLTNDATGQVAQQALSAGAPKAGIEIVRSELFNPNDVDVTPQLTQIKAQNPDAIIAWVVGKPLGVVLKGTKQLGIDKPIVTSHGNISPGFLESLADLQTGPIYVFGTKDLIPSEVPAGDPQKAIIDKMAQAHQAKFGKAPGIGTGTGYDGLMIFAEAVKKANSTEPMKVVEAIEGINRLVGVVGIYTFTKDDHRGLDPSAAIPMEIRSGKLLFAR
jgi:branched-chain amino acid transport system substrate-binding protein